MPSSWGGLWGPRSPPITAHTAAGGLGSSVGRAGELPGSPSASCLRKTQPVPCCRWTPGEQTQPWPRQGLSCSRSWWGGKCGPGRDREPQTSRCHSCRVRGILAAAGYFGSGILAARLLPHNSLNSDSWAADGTASSRKAPAPGPQQRLARERLCTSSRGQLLP